MFQLHRVTSLDLPELAPYRTLRRFTEHHRQRIFVAEGEKVVRRLLESPLAVVSLLLTEDWVPAFEALLRARPESVPVYLVPKAELERLAGFDLYQGVLAVGRCPPALSVEALVADCPRPRLLAAVEGLTSAENVGVLARNCAALGAGGLIVGETTASPYLRRAVRNSMGVIFKLPVAEPPELVSALRELRARGVRCVAAHGQAKRLTLPECDLTGDCCLVFGSEGSGLSEATLAACDEAVSIPMAHGVDSLNVANAAAVFFYEAARQRGGRDR
jgi:tRNA G18 (ribose-2'-O)-methylase SpoU